MKMVTYLTALGRPKKSSLLGNHFVRPAAVRHLRNSSINKPLRFSRNTEWLTQHTMLTPNMAEPRAQYFHKPRLTTRWSASVKDKVPSQNRRSRGVQLNR
jgi:hypothetical protein